MNCRSNSVGGPIEVPTEFAGPLNAIAYRAGWATAAAGLPEALPGDSVEAMVGRVATRFGEPAESIADRVRAYRAGYTAFSAPVPAAPIGDPRD